MLSIYRFRFDIMFIYFSENYDIPKGKIDHFPIPKRHQTPRQAVCDLSLGPAFHINGEDPFLSLCGSCCNRQSRITISLRSHILQAAVACLCLNKPGDKEEHITKTLGTKSKSKLNCI